MLNLKVLEKILKDEPPFRIKQVKEAIFKKLIEKWSEATNLSLPLRERLNKEYPLLVKSEIFNTKDGTAVKFLITLSDGLKIETVLMCHQDGRNTVCVSSAVGCPASCLFCATGKIGFKRNLEVMEIVGQVILVARFLKKKEERVDSVVFMGMGEPFLNYDNVIEAAHILNNKDGLNIGARHISISTVGIIEGIKKIAKEPMQINLAISLHAPNEKLRSEIIPMNKKNNLKSIIEAVDRYIESTGRRVMFEYLMIDKVNDFAANAEELADLLNGLENKLFFVNLIVYNPTGDFRPSTPEQIKKFKNILIKSGITVTERHRFGRSVKGACGQLAGQY
jgi:23S rRNA (adenine2503-C2)-methyltransferase